MTVSVIQLALCKIKDDEVDSSLVVTFSPNQVCYPILLKMLTSVSILLDSGRSVLHLLQSTMQVYATWERNMDKIVAYLSSSQRKIRHCQKELLKCYQHFREMGVKSDTTAISSFF